MIKWGKVARTSAVAELAGNVDATEACGDLAAVAAATASATIAAGLIDRTSLTRAQRRRRRRSASAFSARRWCEAAVTGLNRSKAAGAVASPDAAAVAIVEGADAGAATVAAAAGAKFGAGGAKICTGGDTAEARRRRAAAGALASVIASCTAARGA